MEMEVKNTGRGAKRGPDAEEAKNIGQGDMGAEAAPTRRSRALPCTGARYGVRVAVPAPGGSGLRS